MLYLITGLPGAGKSLHAVSWIPKEFAGRPIYYSGIKDIKLPWHELADGPESWPTVPDGAVVVIDEAQRCMRVRAPGAKVPEHVQQLETHRHRGLDIVIITQHPNLLDTNVRRLVGFHRHVRRTFGMQTAKLFTMDRAFDPESNTELAEANATRWQYDKEAFAKYASAEVHTHKVRLPRRIAFAAMLVLAFAGLTWYAYHILYRLGHPAEAAASAQPGAPAAAPAATGGGKAKAPTTYAEYAEERRPVAPEDVASSARYFNLTQPTRAPRIAGCIRSAQRCQCFTQQATLVQTSELQCAQVLANLVFRDWGPGGESGWTNEQTERERQPERKESSGANAAGGRTGAPAVQPAATAAPGVQVSTGPK